MKHDLTLVVQFCVPNSPWSTVVEFKLRITPAEIDAAKAVFVAKLQAQGVDVTKLTIIYVGVDVTEGCSLSNGRRLQTTARAYTATFHFAVAGPAVLGLQAENILNNPLTLTSITFSGTVGGTSATLVIITATHATPTGTRSPQMLHEMRCATPRVDVCLCI